MNTDKIARYVWIGRKDVDWYQRSEELFTELFGVERLTLVTKLFAATSINTSLKSNITLFRRALDEIETGRPFSNYLPNIKQQLEQIRAGKDLTGRKIRSFAAAMSGDPEAVVVDVWLLRAFGMDRKYFRKEPGAPAVEDQRLLYDDRISNQVHLSDSFTNSQTIPKGQFKPRGKFRSGGASDGQYTKIENWVRTEARAMGLQPRQLSALIWSGVRIDQSGDRETNYGTILRQQLYNMFEVVTLRDWLYSQDEGPAKLMDDSIYSKSLRAR